MTITRQDLEDAANEMLEECHAENTKLEAENAALKSGDVVMVLGLCRSALHHAHLKLTPNSPTERYVWEALKKADEVLAAEGN